MRGHRGRTLSGLITHDAYFWRRTVMYPPLLCICNHTNIASCSVLLAADLSSHTTTANLDGMDGGFLGGKEFVQGTASMGEAGRPDHPHSPISVAGWCISFLPCAHDADYDAAQTLSRKSVENFGFSRQVGITPTPSYLPDHVCVIRLSPES